MAKRLLLLDAGLIGTRILRCANELGFEATVLKTTPSEDTLCHHLAAQAIHLDPELLAREGSELILEAAQALEVEAIHPGSTHYNRSIALAQAAENGPILISPPLGCLDRIRTTERMARVLRGHHILAVHSGLIPKRAVLIDIYVIRTDLDTIVLGAHEVLQSYNEIGVVTASPPLSVTGEQLATLFELSPKIAAALRVRGLGTIRFTVEPDKKPRVADFIPGLTIAHALYEVITGYDLVAEQFRVAGVRHRFDDFPRPAAANPHLPTHTHNKDWGAIDAVRAHNHPNHYALQCAIMPMDLAEDDEGERETRITTFRQPGGPYLRVDENIAPGVTITAKSEPLLCALTVWGHSFDVLRLRMGRALEELTIHGVATNRDLLSRFILQEFIEGAGVEPDTDSALDT